MKMTQADYEARAARVQDDTADDDDRRLVKLYEREGYSHGARTGDEATVTGMAEAEVVPGPKKATRRGAR